MDLLLLFIVMFFSFAFMNKINSMLPGMMITHGFHVRVIGICIPEKGPHKNRTWILEENKVFETSGMALSGTFLSQNGGCRLDTFLLMPDLYGSIILSIRVLKTAMDERLILLPMQGDFFIFNGPTRTL